MVLPVLVRSFLVSFHSLTYHGIVANVVVAGFGLGALNDADEDDLDVYEGGSANRNRLAYDATDDHDGDRISVGGSKSKLVGNSPLRTSTLIFSLILYQGSTSGPSSMVKEPSTAVLPGFMLSGKPVMEDRW